MIFMVCVKNIRLVNYLTCAVAYIFLKILVKIIGEYPLGKRLAQRPLLCEMRSGAYKLLLVGDFRYAIFIEI